jgi:hypothetical protein
VRVSVPLFHDEKIKIKENLVPLVPTAILPHARVWITSTYIVRNRWTVLACKCVSLASESAAPVYSWIMDKAGL